MEVGSGYKAEETEDLSSIGQGRHMGEVKHLPYHISVSSLIAYN